MNTKGVRNYVNDYYGVRRKSVEPREIWYYAGVPFEVNINPLDECRNYPITIDDCIKWSGGCEYKVAVSSMSRYLGGR